MNFEELRILLVDNLMIRNYGNLRMGPGRKLMCGAIRNNWRLCEFSDRDMARLLAPLSIRPLGGVIANRKLVQCAKNFRPDVVLLGHCDYITNETLFEIRRMLPAVKIAHFNVDPIWQGPTRRQIEDRMESCDGIFVTTAGEELKTWLTGKNFMAYMPNPSDPSMEHGDNSRKDGFARDLFFAGNPRAGDPRWDLLAEVMPKIENKLRVELFGSGRIPRSSLLPRPGALKLSPSIWGAKYEEVLSTSKMSLNLNRREGDKWYSSDRIAHLMGYGILTFQSDKNGMDRFFSPEETVYFSEAGDLAERILFYQTHDDERKRIAAAGREKYHRIFSGERVLKFMIETLYNIKYTEPYEWAEEVYR